MARAELSHERRVDRVTQQSLERRRHLSRQFGRHRQREVLLLTCPWLTVLIGECTTGTIRSIRAPAVYERAGEDHARAGGHFHRARQLFEPLLAGRVFDLDLVRYVADRGIAPA